jgi:Tfp pilus assembly protein PilX
MFWKRSSVRGGDESGVALLMVLIVTVLLLGLGMALSTNAMLETEITSNHDRELLAFYAAQTGLERAIDGFRTNYTVNTLPVDGATLFTDTQVSYPGSKVTSTYTVTVARRDAPVGSQIAPYPIHYTITSVGKLVPANTAARVSSVTLSQTLCVSPRSLANFTLFYDTFGFELAFQSTFKLAGRLAVNDPGGVNTYPDTTVNGDFYSAGPITKYPPFGLPKVSGNITENGGRVNFPSTIAPFSSGASDNYKFTGTTRLIFAQDGSFTVYNNNIPGGSKVMPIPPNGIVAVTAGDCVVEGKVHGRVTVTCDQDILINGGVRYADQSPSSSDTLALVAQNDIILPEYQYTGVGPTLTDFDAGWNGGHWETDYITGGSWGGRLPGDFSIDATMVALNGSSPTVINPGGRLPGQLYVYGNSLAHLASVTVYMNGNSIANGLNENYTENKKLDLVPPPGFPLDTKLLPTFFAFREVRTAIQ